MLNINCGKNQQLTDACEPLKEYAWLVDTVRRHQQEKMDLDAAVDAAISEMPDEYAIKPFLKSLSLTRQPDASKIYPCRQSSQQI